MRNRFLPLAMIAGIVAAGTALIVPANVAAEDFYKGKTIRFVVGAPAGGGYDTYTRAIARHLGKHIPGNPAMVVENMDGAGTGLMWHCVLTHGAFEESI